MRIRLWQGYHTESLRVQLAESWKNGDLFILCPPYLKDFSFTDQLPEGDIDFNGTRITRSPRSRPLYPETPVLGVFTSGTVSGVPRLVLYSKQNVESSLDAILSVFDRSRIQSVFCYPQPFHTFGLTLGYMMSIVHGYELVTGAGRYSTGFHALRARQESEKLLTLGTPTHFYDLIQFVRAQKMKLRPSYSCIIGGAKVTRTLWQDVRETLNIERPSIGYGATEAAPGITHHPPGQRPLEDGEIGHVLPHLTVELHSGRGLEFSGSSMCMAMIQGGKIEFPTKIVISDDVRRRGDGMLTYHGRTELILNRGGQKFSLEYVEEVIRKEFNLEAVCLNVPDERLGEDLGVLIRTDSVKQMDQVHASLCKFFESGFERGNFVAVAEFPMNDNAKVDRRTGAKLLMRQRDLE